MGKKSVKIWKRKMGSGSKGEERRTVRDPESMAVDSSERDGQAGNCKGRKIKIIRVNSPFDRSHL